MVNVGVIGAGHWGKNLIRNIDAHPQVDKVLICDRDEAALNRYASRFPSSRLYTDLDKALSQEWLDAVIIASPSDKHGDHALKCMKKGLHVLVEKPFTTSLAESVELVEEAEKKNLVLMVDHTFLYNNIIEEVKKIIQNGDLGDLYYLYSKRVNLGIVRSDINVIWNLAPHDISIANYIMGELPVKVGCTSHCYLQKDLGVPDVAYINLIYSDGRSAHIHNSWLDPLKQRDMVVVGSKKMLVYDDVNTSRHIQIYDKKVDMPALDTNGDFNGFHGPMALSGDLMVPNIRLMEPLRRLVDHFVSCIQNNTVPLTDGRHACEVIAILETLEASRKSNGEVLSVKYP